MAISCKDLRLNVTCFVKLKILLFLWILDVIRVKFLQDGHRDGGYLSTSRMILECALCMALQESELQADSYASQNPGGVLTPSSALGLVLHERLKNAGYELEVCDAFLPHSEKKAA